MSDERTRDPGRYFGTPAKLVAADDLSRSAKIEALTNWANEIRQLQVAEEENMKGPSDLGSRLQDVERALLELGADDPAHDAKA